MAFKLDVAPLCTEYDALYNGSDVDLIERSVPKLLESGRHQQLELGQLFWKGIDGHALDSLTTVPLVLDHHTLQQMQ